MHFIHVALGSDHKNYNFDSCAELSFRRDDLLRGQHAKAKLILIEAETKFLVR